MYLRDIWPTQAEIAETNASAIGTEMFTDNYEDVFKGDERWAALPTPEGARFEWDAESTYIKLPPYFEGMTGGPGGVRGHCWGSGAAQAGGLDHDGPHLAGRVDQGCRAGRVSTDEPGCRRSSTRTARGAGTTR